MSDDKTSAREIRVRGIIFDSRRKMFLGMVNNRVTPGVLTMMLPGGKPSVDERPIDALQRFLQMQLSISVQLDETNSRFLKRKTYPISDNNEYVDIVFYRIDLEDIVPLNLDPENILSVGWFTLADLERYIDLSTGGWMVQMGAMDAIKAALDPKQLAAPPRSERNEQNGTDSPRKPEPIPYGT